jgi:hypothetical protein
MRRSSVVGHEYPVVGLQPITLLLLLLQSSEEQLPLPRTELRLSKRQQVRLHDLMQVVVLRKFGSGLTTQRSSIVAAEPVE